MVLVGFGGFGFILVGLIWFGMVNRGYAINVGRVYEMIVGRGYVIQNSESVSELALLLLVETIRMRIRRDRRRCLDRDTAGHGGMLECSQANHCWIVSARLRKHQHQL